MADTIDTLQIEISATANDASKKIDALVSSLNKLKNSVKGTAGLDTLAQRIKALADATNSLTSSGAKNLSDMATALQMLSTVQKPKSISTIAKNLESLGKATNSLSYDGAQALMAYTKLLQYLSAIPKASGLSSTVNALSKLKSVDFSGISEENMRALASALNVLGDVKTSEGLKTTLTQLNRIPKIMEALDSADLEKFANQMKEVASAMKPLADEMDKIARGFDKFPSKITSTISAIDKMSTTAKRSSSVFGTFNSSFAKFGLFYLSFDKVVDVLSDALNESNAYVENLNLFTVSMGEYAEEAKQYAETVQDALGIDSSEWMRNQAVFMQIASGFGVVSDKAALMSKNLTQIGYDLSSYFNISVEEAMLKVQSGISGELEPLRRLGYALDVATLQQVAYNHGITESINTMTQAQKSQLRYVAIMEQSGNAMRDLSRTILTPANSIRILQQQITQLSRALGNLLIPFLIKVIPYVQAFVEVLTEAIQFLANLVGFELPEIDYSGLGNVTAGAGEAEEALDGAADAAKKLKDYTLGIDELNIISPDTGDAGTGSVGGVGGGYDLPLELPEYDFLGDVKKQTDELKDKMRDLLYNYIIPIGLAFLAWKLGTTLFNDLKMLKDVLSGLSTLGKIAISLVISGIEFVLVKKFMDDFLSEGGSFWDLLKAIATIAVGSGILYALLGPTGLVIGVGVGVVAMLTSISSSILNGADPSSGKILISGIVASLLGAVPGFFLGGPLGAVIGFALTLGIVFSVTSVMAEISGQIDSSSKEAVVNKTLSALSVGLAGAGIGFVIGGPIGAAVGFIIGTTVTFMLQEAAISFGEWYQNISGVLDGIDVLGEGVSEVTREKMQPFLDSIQELDTQMKTLKFGNIEIDESIVSNTRSIMSDISQAIKDGLDADKNGAAESIEKLKNLLGEDMYSSIIESSNQYYDNAANQVDEYNSRINEIMQNAADEKRAITSTEWAEINKIQSDMQNLGIKTISDTQVEYETIMRNLKDNSVHISLEQSSEIIKNAISTKDEAIKAAEDQYSRTLLEAQKMYEAGAINSEQYQAIKDAALTAKNETIQAATEQYQSIYDTTVEKLGETSKYIDLETGEIKSKWTVFWEDVSTGWNNMWDAVSKGWEDFKKSFKQGWFDFWYGIGNFFIDIWNGIVSALEWAANGIIDILNSISIDIPETPFTDAMHIGFNLSPVSFDRAPHLKVPTFASGGFPEQGQLFFANESGPELVGRIGNRTAVANGDQIVSGIQFGVETANAPMVSVLYQLLDVAERIAEKDNTVQIGDEVIGASANRYNSNKGYNLGIST